MSDPKAQVAADGADDWENLIESDQKPVVEAKKEEETKVKFKEEDDVDSDSEKKKVEKDKKDKSGTKSAKTAAKINYEEKFE